MKLKDLLIERKSSGAGISGEPGVFRTACFVRQRLQTTIHKDVGVVNVASATFKCGW